MRNEWHLLLFNTFACCGHHQSTMFNPLYSLKFCENIANLGGPSSHDKNFHTVVMIKVNMLAAYNQTAKIMLYINQLLYRAALVMVVNKANRPRHIRILLPFLFYKSLPIRLFMASDRVG
jgi:hypothetical protein